MKKYQKYIIFVFIIIITSNIFTQDKTDPSKTLEYFLKMDLNNDGIITKSEWKGREEVFI